MIKKTYKIEVYNGYRLVVVVTPNITESLKKSKVLLPPNDEDNFDGLTTYCPTIPHEVYICIKPTSNLSTISHEAFHATYRILSSVGCELSGESEEPYAYLLGYIVDKVLDTCDIYFKKYPD